MRRTLKWLAGLVGLAAVARVFSRRHAPAPAPVAARPPDPAEELRRKLDDTRAGEPSDGPAGTSPDEPVSLDEPLSLDERRARVHGRAQEAIDLMREPDDDDPGSGAA